MTWVHDQIDPALLVAYCFAFGIAVRLSIAVGMRSARRIRSDLTIHTARRRTMAEDQET